MAKPSALPEWASTLANDPTTGQPNRVEPAGSKKVTGWNYNEKPPRQYMNWFQWLVYKWVEWFDSNIDQGVKTTDEPTFSRATISNTLNANTVNAPIITSNEGDFTDGGSGTLDSDVITATVSVSTADLSASGFSSFGHSTSKIKIKLYTGTTAASTTLINLTSALIADGIAINKILNFDVAIATLPDVDNTIAFSDSPSFPYRRYVYNGLVGVDGDAVGLQGKAYRVLITYME